MILQERIGLRDYLFDALVGKGAIVECENGTNALYRKRLASIFSNDKLLGKAFTDYSEQFRSKDEALYCITHHDDFENHHCPVCNELSSYYEKQHKYKVTCASKRCLEALANSKAANKKRKSTNMTRYGTEHVLQNTEIRAKGTATTRERYGVDNAMQSREVQAKMHTTTRAHYGVDHAMQSPKVKARFCATMVKRHGAEYPIQCDKIRAQICTAMRNRHNVDFYTQNDEMKAKSEATNLRRRGVKNVMQDSDIQARVRATNIKRYGVENPMQSPDVQAKVCATNLKRRGVRWSCQDPEVRRRMLVSRYIHSGTPNPVCERDVAIVLNSMHLTHNDIWASDNNFASFIYQMHSMKDRQLRLNEIADIFGVAQQTVKKRADRLGMIHLFSIHDVPLEAYVANFLTENDISFSRHNRSILLNESQDAHQEIDILVGSIGIEIDDLCSHNIAVKDCNYHAAKSAQAASKGIRLIHLWEWELTDSVLWRRVSNWLLNELDDSKIIINTDDCSIREVQPNEACAFINQYSIYSHQQQSICYGLYHNNELVQLASFTSNQSGYKLQHVCTRYHITVVNGAQYLLQHFIKMHDPHSITVCCDLAKFDILKYQKLGFTAHEIVQPRIMQYNNGRVECNPRQPIASKAIYDCGAMIYEMVP